MFLDLVRETAGHDPALARDALAGLRRYQAMQAPPRWRERPIIASQGGVHLRDCGGQGSTLVLVPSLINPPHVLDLDDRSSLAEALSAKHRVMLLDWGRTTDRHSLDLTQHITDRLLPLLDGLGTVVLVGYCLGGTLALAAATQRSAIEGVVTLAAPWNFSAYPDGPIGHLQRMWRSNCQAARLLGGLPMELLQAMFWQLDPVRTVAKFAAFSRYEVGSTEERRFLMLEEWANGGEPLPLHAASELVEAFFTDDAPGRGEWLGHGLPSCPQLHVTAHHDRIVPAATAPAGARLESTSGHVGMIVGRDAAERLHRPLLSWLDALGKGR